MGMTREEFAILVKSMKAVYPQPTFLPDQDAFNVWYEMLKDIDYKNCAMAIQSHISTEIYPPTIAHIRNKVFTNNNVNDITEADAWDLVRRAISDSTYHSQERFDELPKDIQRAVGSPNQLRVWAMDSDFNDGVVQSNFLKIYRSERKRSEEFARLPIRLQQALTTTAQALIGD